MKAAINQRAIGSNLRKAAVFQRLCQCATTCDMFGKRIRVMAFIDSGYTPCKAGFNFVMIHSAPFALIDDV
ncbi:MAG: hypothetical protein MI808_22060 [Pseudomonadales bacterium]|nr:hypothetical protein [Pseudomonadales bacterium]